MVESETFRMIVEAFKNAVYRSAHRVLRDHDEALDVTQDTFVAYHERGGDVPAERIRPWLVRVATNRAFDVIRRRKRAIFSPAMDERTAAAAGGAGGRAERNEERDRVMAALARLPKRQREVLTLRVWEQRTFVEIATSLSISEGACKVHYRRGLEALRTRLTPELQGARDERP